MTNDAQCEEVTDLLHIGQSYHDRVDICNQVFMAKFKELCRDILTNGIFGKVTGFTWTKEYSKYYLFSINYVNYI